MCAGLDAATLFDVARWLRAMTHHLGMTVIVSLLQPPPETFALFDDLILMNEGVVVYHGPLQAALPHVQSLGFEMPPRKVRPYATIRPNTVWSAFVLCRATAPGRARLSGLPASRRDLASTATWLWNML